MNKTKRLVLLIFSAVLAMSLVPPALASADGEWLKNGEEFAGEFETPYEATFYLAKYSSQYGVECTFHGTATFTGGTSQAQIDNVENSPLNGGDPPADSRCYNPWGSYECQGQPTIGEPWSLHPEASGWKLDSFGINTHIHNLLSEQYSCFYNNDLKVSSSGLFREGSFVDPIYFQDILKAETTSSLKQYETFGSLELHFPESGISFYQYP